jgi:hypothetical protein
MHCRLDPLRPVEERPQDPGQRPQLGRACVRCDLDRCVAFIDMLPCARCRTMSDDCMTRRRRDASHERGRPAMSE